MCNKPPIDWTKTLEVFDPDNPGRSPRPAKLLVDNYRMKSGFVCRLVLVENEDHTTTYLYHRDGTFASLYCPELRNKTKKVTKWYNLYTDGPGARYRESESEAVRHIAHTRSYVRTCIAQIEVPE